MGKSNSATYQTRVRVPGKAFITIALIEIILMKFRRIEALYSKDPQTNTVPELQDIINYAIFAKILVRG